MTEAALAFQEHMFHCVLDYMAEHEISAIEMEDALLGLGANLRASLHEHFAGTA